VVAAAGVYDWCGDGGVHGACHFHGGGEGAEGPDAEDVGAFPSLFGDERGELFGLIARRKEEDFLHERLIRHYMEHTVLKTPEEVESVLLRDVDAWLTPEEAMEYGIADRIEHKNRTMRG
jgi:hypothetical protein